MGTGSSTLENRTFEDFNGEGKLIKFKNCDYDKETRQGEIVDWELLSKSWENYKNCNFRLALHTGDVHLVEKYTLPAASYEGCSFEGLKGVKFNGATVPGLETSDLLRWDFKSTKGLNPTFRHCDFRSGDITGATNNISTFINCGFQNAKITHATITYETRKFLDDQCQLCKCELVSCTIQGLEKVRDVKNVVFHECQLDEATLAEVNKVGANNSLINCHKSNGEPLQNYANGVLVSEPMPVTEKGSAGPLAKEPEPTATSGGAPAGGAITRTARRLFDASETSVTVGVISGVLLCAFLGYRLVQRFRLPRKPEQDLEPDEMC